MVASSLGAGKPKFTFAQKKYNEFEKREKVYHYFDA